MNKKKVLKLFLIVFIIIIDFLIIKYLDRDNLCEMKVQLFLSSDYEQEIQLYYKESDMDGWNENDSVKQKYSEVSQIQELTFSVPGNMKNIRLDFGEEASDISIDKIQVKYKNSTLDCNLEELIVLSEDHSIKNSYFEKGKFFIETEENDPYIVLQINQKTCYAMQQIQRRFTFIKNIGLVICISLLFILILIKFDKIVDLAYSIISDYKLIFNLGKNDFKTKYAGSYFGILWAFVQPIVTILVYWFVFDVAFNGGPIDGCPYVLWLISGLIPWFFFQEALQSATNSLIEYSYLVKKVVFNISIIPIVKIVSALFVHIFFVIILVIIFEIGGADISINVVQLIYYSFCMVLFTTALSYFTSALVVFFRDLGQVIGILLQIGIWLTPIMWNYKTIGNSTLRMVLQMNPMFYIVNGYRESLITNGWIWDNPNLTIYFWLLTICLMLIGGNMFNKLRVHFADVL